MTAPIELSTQHYMDTPADIMLFETSVRGSIKTTGPNGFIRTRFPGFVRELWRFRGNFKIASGFVAESCCRPDEPGAVLTPKILKALPKRFDPDNIRVPCIPPGHSKQLVIAGTCLYAAGISRVPPPVACLAMQNFFEWFWSQKRFQSVGMGLIGMFSCGCSRMPACVEQNITAWTMYQAEALVKNNIDVMERKLIIHSGESLHMTVPNLPAWDGEFRRVVTIKPAIAKIEPLSNRGIIFQSPDDSHITDYYA